MWNLQHVWKRKACLHVSVQIKLKTNNRDSSCNRRYYIKNILCYVLHIYRQILYTVMQSSWIHCKYISSVVFISPPEKFPLPDMFFQNRYFRIIIYMCVEYWLCKQFSTISFCLCQWFTEWKCTIFESIILSTFHEHLTPISLLSLCIFPFVYRCLHTP